MTNAEARFNKSLRPRKPEGSLGRTAQDVHLNSHTAPELFSYNVKYWVIGDSNRTSVSRIKMDLLKFHFLNFILHTAVFPQGLVISVKD